MKTVLCNYFLLGMISSGKVGIEGFPHDPTKASPRKEFHPNCVSQPLTHVTSHIPPNRKGNIAHRMGKAGGKEGK